MCACPDECKSTAIEECNNSAPRQGTDWHLSADSDQCADCRRCTLPSWHSQVRGKLTVLDHWSRHCFAQCRCFYCQKLPWFYGVAGFICLCVSSHPFNITLFCTLGQWAIHLLNTGSSSFSSILYHNAFSLQASGLGYCGRSKANLWYMCKWVLRLKEAKNAKSHLKLPQLWFNELPGYYC